MKAEIPQIRVLLPIGSHVEFNPSRLKDSGLYLGMLDSLGANIINFDYSHHLAYMDNQVTCMILSYEDDATDPDLIYMTLMPDEKEDTILFVRMPREYKGPISFLVLLDQDQKE